MADETNNPVGQTPPELTPLAVESVPGADETAGIVTDGTDKPKDDVVVADITAQKAETATDTPTPPPVTPKVEDKEIKDLMTKKGFKSANDVAKSYIALEREFHQRNQTKPAETHVEQPPVPQGNEESLNDKFLQDWTTKPIETVVGLFQAMKATDPEFINLRESARLATFESEINSLSRDEETKDILTAEVSQAVSETLKSRPYLWESPSPVADAYLIAKASLSKTDRVKAIEEGRRQAEQESARANKAFVETGKSVKETVDITKLSAADLKERLRQLGAVRE